MSKYNPSFVAYQVERYVELHAKDLVSPAFNGNVEAAFKLSCRLGNENRGAVAVSMWRAKVPLDAFRVFFSNAWNHDHHHIINAAKTHRALTYMFRYADFPIPDELPEVVTVWRGTSVLTIDKAKIGCSWTLDRDVACWFAMRHANSSPLVLIAKIPKSQIVMFEDEGDEREVVLVKPPTSCAIDGNVDNWKISFQRKEDSNRVRDKKMMAEVIGRKK